MIKTGKFLGAICLLVFLATLTVQDSYASYACTPGYWKTHTDEWVGLSPLTKVKILFPATALTPIGEATLLEALSFPGGPGVDGAIRIFVRTAVAFVLNFRKPGLLGWTCPDPAPMLNEIIASANRTTILAAAEWYDSINNSFCPLN